MTQATAPKPKIFTFEKYLAYNDGTDTRYELVDGELVKITPESDDNNDVAKRLLKRRGKAVQTERSRNRTLTLLHKVACYISF
jgi:Uma2 family endonuclease